MYQPTPVDIDKQSVDEGQKITTTVAGVDTVVTLIGKEEKKSRK